MAKGRPSQYREAYCDEIINIMAGGLSLTAAMADLGFHRDTAYDWQQKYPAFSDAVKVGHAKRQAFLERRLLSATEGPVVTSSIFGLKNCSGGDFRERHDIEHTGKDGGPIETKATIDVSKLSTAAMEELLNAATDNG